MKLPVSVAIVDDHPGMGKSIESLLKDEGCNVFLLEQDGRIFLDKISQLKELPQICIVDGNMPKMSGAEVCKQLSQLYPAIEIVAFTMSDNKSYIDELLNNGASKCLQKGCDVEILLNAILDG
jgi:DNA-binding NarL/FixJ family response regulator